MKLNIKMKVSDLKLAVLVIASLFILGQAFLTLAEEKNSATALFLDSDQDGLSDEEEKTYGTNPLNSDTDNDGYSDGNEIKSGYDPLKPAPGDKIEIISNSNSAEQYSNEAKENLTEKLVEQTSLNFDLNEVLEIGENGEYLSGKISVSADEIKDFTQEFLDKYVLNQSSELITADDIKIKKQNYSNFASEEAESRKNNDFLDYLASVLYVLSYNSSESITSMTDLDNAFIKLGEKSNVAFTKSDSAYFNELLSKTSKVLTQLKEIEVPEELLEIPLDMLNILNESLALKNSIIVSTDEDDPVSDLINSLKIQSFLENFINFYSEVSDQISQYDIDENYIEEKINEIGKIE